MALTLCSVRGDSNLRSNTRRIAFGLAFCLSGLVCVSGCSQPASGDDGQRVYFNPLERDARAIREVEAPAPPVSIDENPRLERIVTGFRQRALQVFRRDDPERPLDEIERIFQSTGMSLRLLDVYQRVVDEQGLESAAAPRLAWILVRLGQEKQARNVLDRLLDNQSDSAMVHFVEGSYWLNRVRESPEAAARAVLSWRRALELDPEFEGPERLGASALRRKIQQLEQRLPNPPEQVLASAETQPSGVDDVRSGSDGDRNPERGGESREGDRERSRGDEEPSDTAPDTGEAGRESRDVGASAQPSDAGRADAGGDTATAVPVLATRADLALSRGDVEKAGKLYRRILDRRDGDDLESQFGILRVQLRQDASASKLAEQLRSLVDREDLTADLAYDMGLFAQTKLDAPALAERLRERVRELDPEYAERVGIGSQ